MATASTAPPKAIGQIDSPFPLRFWHLTSLDAPTVAVTWSLAFAWTTQSHLPLWLPAVLALAAWSFYIVDRLFDAHRALGTARHSDPATLSKLRSLRPRHHFHWHHRRIFVPIAIIAAFAAFVLVLHSMPLAARTRNSVLAAAALVYFTSVHSPWRPAIRKLSASKELFVGIIFTLACVAPAWARSPFKSRAELFIPILIFTALAWLNCHAIETWESTSSSTSRTRIFPLAVTLILAAALASTAAATLHTPRAAALLATAALSAALLALLDRTQRRLSSTTLRATADLVLLTPLILLFLP